MGLERLWVQPGMKVFGADGEYIGQVKQVRERDFVVSRPRHRDLSTPEVIERVEGDTVVLKIDAREFNLLADVEA